MDVSSVDHEKAATSRRTPKWAFISPFQMRLRRGIESYVWSLSSALAESGIEVDILTWPGPVVQPENGNITKVALHFAPSIGYYEKYFAAPYYCGKFLFNRYDHVLVNFAGYGEGPALKLINSIKAVPFSVVFHFPRTLVPHRYLEFERWGLSQRAQHLIGVSDFVGQQVEDWAGRPVAVIGHGVDTKRFRPDFKMRRRIREALGIKPETKLLVTVAALEERKGIQWVIRTLAGVRESIPDTYYLVLGQGNYRSKLLALANDLGLAGRVILKDPVENVEEYLGGADIALLLSTAEASPMALLEYAASGLPAITSQQPPFSELMREEWGIMIDETDTAGLAETIISLLARPERRAQMGSAGRLWAETNHSWQRVAREYRQLIG